MDLMFLTVRETARICRVSIGTMRRWCRNKEIDGKRVGGKYLISRQEIDRKLSVTETDATTNEIRKKK